MAVRGVHKWRGAPKVPEPAQNRHHATGAASVTAEYALTAGQSVVRARRVAPIEGKGARTAGVNTIA
jgi:hypothetical protein